MVKEKFSKKYLQLRKKFDQLPISATTERKQLLVLLKKELAKNYGKTEEGKRVEAFLNGLIKAGHTCLKGDRRCPACNQERR